MFLPIFVNSHQRVAQESVVDRLQQVRQSDDNGDTNGRSPDGGELPLPLGIFYIGAKRGSRKETFK